MFTVLSLISGGFSFIKGFFTKSSSSSGGNYFIKLLFITLGVILTGYLIYSYINKNKIASLQTANVLLNESNKNLSKTLKDTIITNKDSTVAIDNVNNRVIADRKESSTILHTKRSKIQAIENYYASESKSKPLTLEMQSTENNLISKTEIDSIWLEYCYVYNIPQNKCNILKK